MTVDVQEFFTDDPEQARDAVNAAYGFERPISVSGDATNFTFRMWHASAGEIAAGYVHHGMTADMVIPPAGFFLVDTLLGGTFDELSVNGQTARGRPGDSLLCSHDAEMIGRWSDIEVASVQIRFDTVRRVARERSDLRVDDVHFDAIRPVSPAAARRWRALAHFIQREIAAPGSMLEEPLLQTQLAELIATTALTTFRNSMMLFDASGRRVRLSSESLRRAVAFIEDNAHRPITVSQIAEAVGVTPRALQYSFGRAMGISPKTYLRRIRLEYAHRELQSTPPGSGVTVAQICRRWGFSHPGRFAASYHAAYGRSPSETLRRG